MQTIAIQDTFLEAFSKLPKVEQKRTRQMIDLLRSNPDNNGLNFERYIEAVDPKVHSIRISQGYRAIAVRPDKEGVILLVWVDHHDEAYRWAKRKRFEVNPFTGVLQMWTSAEENTPTASVEEAVGLFAEYSNKQLLKLGVPEELLSHIRNIQSEDELDEYIRELPIETAEALQFLLTGDPYDEVLEFVFQLKAEREDEMLDTKPASFAEAVAHPKASRHIVVVTSDVQLNEMLEQPLERWRTFLHPTQKELVEKDYKGPVRVLGGAGTGKTVVAMHRARHLVREKLKSGERVLVTTFTVNLADTIREILSTMCTEVEMQRIDVISIDRLAFQIAKKYCGLIAHPVGSDHEDVKAIWENAMFEHGWNVGDLTFLKNEYYRVIQQNGVDTWEEYLDTKRVGRKKRLSRAEKKKIWGTIQWVREKMKEKNIIEHIDVQRMARKWLEENRGALVYRAAIVDEAQDFHPEAFKLLRILVPEGDNDLFIVGDAHQRIYSRHVVLSRCGINIRGQRSKRLRINYRTTEQIRRKAMEMLHTLTFDDLDGGHDDGKDISLLAGSAPEIVNFNTLSEERKFVVDKVIDLLNEGIQLGDIAVLARNNYIADQYVEAFKKAELKAHKLSTDTMLNIDAIHCGTMHRSKGLEFRAVFIVEVNENVIPPEYVVNQMDDEEELEELKKQERSLLYVASTRAREKLYVTSFGPPSVLVRELILGVR
ncbi:UvrD-helicase domain-containing protein [Laceyella putida]|uniref:DNA 3'-5' helicase n=1 Tax=Laceyella putida TaxID=110101 RepID=A0ABW2RQ68_9BACL